jgi:hypothetical protein
MEILALKSTNHVPHCAPPFIFFECLAQNFSVMRNNLYYMQLPSFLPLQTSPSMDAGIWSQLPYFVSPQRPMIVVTGCPLWNSTKTRALGPQRSLGVGTVKWTHVILMWWSFKLMFLQIYGLCFSISVTCNTHFCLGRSYGILRQCFIFGQGDSSPRCW